MHQTGYGGRPPGYYDLRLFVKALRCFCRKSDTKLIIGINSPSENGIRYSGLTMRPSSPINLSGLKFSGSPHKSGSMWVGKDVRNNCCIFWNLEPKQLYISLCGMRY